MVQREGRKEKNHLQHTRIGTLHIPTIPTKKLQYSVVHPISQVSATRSRRRTAEPMEAPNRAGEGQRQVMCAATIPAGSALSP